MEQQPYIPKVLVGTSPTTAVKAAKKEILEEREGKQLGLKVRWETLNVANRKYFRFKQIYLLAGPSGHGKSYLLNEIINDFFDKQHINKNFAGNFIVLYFCYEMSAVDEVIRTLGSKMRTSYGKILSSQWNKEKKEYEGLSEKELKEAFETLDKISNRPLMYFETAGNLRQLEATVAAYSIRYPNSKIVVAIDHTLLSEKLTENTDIDLMANTGKTALRLKKQYGCMVLMLGQLNNAIEDYKRLANPTGQYPIKSDIYAQGQLFNACDSVMTILQPSMLKLTHYGKKKIPTKDLMHLQYLKARHGKIGSIWLENRLDEGMIVEKDVNSLREIPTDEKKDA
tara:strand:- start:42162 stop:43181 length:1020 start_codon:yes stop_codon:yes gene_type:complete